ncbi:hypothetical protein [Streptomyces sp. NEAU-174]|uniref:hypothetical protein n=1 Tax=Streptomyces sp. NEAU-174 TaxID=3458254 RepID=UPI004044D4E2
MNTVTTLVPEARAAYGVYATFPRRRYAADMLIERITPMQAHASARAENSRAWSTAAKQLSGAIDAVSAAIDTPLLGGRPIRRAATAIALDAILAFETAHATSLPYDDHGRYNPAPGTEYQFSVSDIGRATVQLLGPDWHAESTPWGVGARLARDGEPRSTFTLGVDEIDDDLYVRSDLIKSTVYLSDACAVDGLDVLAARVADTVRSLRNGEG